MNISLNFDTDVYVVYIRDFDKHHYKDFHRNQCTEPTPLELDITFDAFLEIASGN